MTFMTTLSFWSHVYYIVNIWRVSLVTCLLFGFVVVAQRHGRVQETQLKCTKARNDYLLNLAAANAAMNKYYLQDVSTLIDV